MKLKMPIWRQLKISDLIENESLEIGDGYRAKNSEMASAGLPFARAGNVNNGFDFEDADFLSQKSVTQVGNKISQPDDAVITTKGTFGRVAYVRPSTPRFVYSPQLCYWRVKNSSVIQPRFVYYWLQGPDFLSQAFQVKSSTDMADYTSLTDQRRMVITAPDVESQKKIAAILSAYDELIENNQRRIALLEKMAAEIYREWFVRMRFPGHEKVKFVKGVPADWKQMLIGDLITRISPGKKYEQKTALESGEIPILDQGQSGVIGYHNDEPGVFASPEKPVIVFANHTCYQHLIFFPFSAIQNVLPFIPSTTNKSNIFWLNMATNGIVELNDYKGHWPAFVSKRIFYPNFELTQLFGDIVAPIFKQKFLIEKANEAIKESRDMLLPRLISGKLSVEHLDIQFPPGMEDRP